MEIIKVRVGKHEVLIEKEDYERLGKPELAVYADGNGGMLNVRIITGVRGSVYLHKEIYGPIPEGFVVDHKDRNKLNNLRSNLRLATPTQNRMNTDRRPGKSGIRGVTKRHDCDKWRADMSINGKLTYLGTFDTKEQAAEAYNKASLKHRGEFSPLNS